MQQIERIEREIIHEERDGGREPLQEKAFGQTRYRWVVLAVASMMMMLNGLLNNIIIPLESKLAGIYGINGRVVNIATILSFLAFLLVNVPANYLLDQKGLKFGLMLSNALSLIGIILACLINQAFPCLLAGYLLFTLGQPFVTNCPAKLATHWFLPHNRALATSIMVGSSVIGSGIGFAIPALVVRESSEGEYAKREIFSLYLGYAIATLVMLAINFLLMKEKPKIPPSKIDKKQSLTIRQTFMAIKADRNLWKFFGGYSLFYGTFLIFGASSNFLIKPFGYTDLMISLAAVGLIVMGTIGAILSSLFIKRTQRYKLVISLSTFGSSGMLLLMTLQLILIPIEFITMIIVALIGMLVVPVVPASYEIGCQVAFPIGEAQVTGILNGGALIWAFLMDSILTAAVGFGTPTRTVIFMLILILFLLAGSFLYFKTEILLKRTQFQQESQSETSSPQNSRAASSEEGKDIELTTAPFKEENPKEVDGRPSNYLTLIEEKSL